MSTAPSRSRRLSILAVCLLALLVRAWGLDWGLPRVDLHPDEQMVLQITQRISWQSLDPGFYNYSGLTFHLNFFATEIARALGGTIDDAGQLLAHRALGLLFGTLTTLLVYPIARRLRLGHAAALTAMLVFAILPLHVWDSHFAVADVGLAFWSTLALWLALRAYERPSLGRFAAGGLVVGIAIATKFNGALAGSTFIASAALVWWEGRAPARVAIRNLIVAGAVSLAGFAIASPYSLINLQQTNGALQQEWSEVRAGHYGFDMSAEGWQYHRGVYQLAVMFPFSFGLALWPVVVAGGALLTWRGSPAQRALAWAHIGLYLATTASWSLVPLRYYLPILPMAAIFAGYGLDAIRRSPRLPRGVGAALVLLVLGYTAVFTAATTYRFTADTRVVAGAWGDANLPAGTHVYLLYPAFERSYMPVFSREDIVVQSVPLERARDLGAMARQDPERTWVVTSGLTYQRDYRQGAYASLPDAHRRWHREPDPIGAWDFVRANPEVFQLAKRFSSWFPNKRLYMSLDPMYEGYFVSPTIELYRHDPDAVRELRRQRRIQQRRATSRVRSGGGASGSPPGT